MVKILTELPSSSVYGGYYNYNYFITKLFYMVQFWVQFFMVTYPELSEHLHSIYTMIGLMFFWCHWLLHMLKQRLYYLSGCLEPLLPFKKGSQLSPSYMEEIY